MINTLLKNLPSLRPSVHGHKICIHMSVIISPMVGLSRDHSRQVQKSGPFLHFSELELWFCETINCKEPTFLVCEVSSQ